MTNPSARDFERRTPQAAAPSTEPSADRLNALIGEARALRERCRWEKSQCRRTIERARALRGEAARVVRCWSVLAAQPSADTTLAAAPSWASPQPPPRRAIAPPEPSAGEPATVVAIGSSAGGLAALYAVLGSVPPDFPGAVLVAQHDARPDLGLLPDLLRPRSALPVQVLTAGGRPRAGRVLLVPGGHHLTFDADGRFVLRAAPAIRPPGAPFCPSIDLLFRSLAAVYAERAIAVVLSGMATDGALACRAVLEHGGVVITQQGRSASHDEMPTAAADLARPDLILTPRQIGFALDCLARHRASPAG